MLAAPLNALAFRRDGSAQGVKNLLFQFDAFFVRLQDLGLKMLQFLGEVSFSIRPVYHHGFPPAFKLDGEDDTGIQSGAQLAAHAGIGAQHHERQAGGGI